MQSGILFKDRYPIDQFHHDLKQSITRPMMAIELCTYPEDVPSHLNGSGLVIINPPWKFDQEMNEPLIWLWKTLSVNHQGTHRIFSLN